MIGQGVDSTGAVRTILLDETGISNPGDPAPVKIAGSVTATVNTSALATAAKQDIAHADLAAILTKLSSDPASQTTLAAVLAKLIALPATEAKQDTANTSLGSIDTKLVKNAVGLTPTSRDYGSLAASGTATALGGSTNYTAGIFVMNSDLTAAVTIGTGTPVVGAGSNKIVLGPGQGYWEPSGDLSAIKIISAGTPIVSWIGMTK